MGDEGHGKGQQHPDYHKYHTLWEEEQKRLRDSIVDNDAEDWDLPGKPGAVPLRLIAGVDISFVKEDPDVACAAIVVSEVPSFKIRYEKYKMVRLTLPYISGFLAFRECVHLVELLDELKATQPELTPQILMVDGMGVLHPRGLGLASHLGVLTGIPTIGVGKNFLNVDGLRREETVAESRKHLHNAGDVWELRGDSGVVHGVALRSTADAPNPVFVSRGHLITLPTTVEVVRLCCKYRVPEPIRLADKGSREYIRVNYHPSTSDTSTTETFRGTHAGDPEVFYINAIPLHGDKYVLALHRQVREGQQDKAQTAKRLSFHFCLDNSGSMGQHSILARDCFSELVNLATDPCSLTIFESKAVVLSDNIKTSDEMKRLALPSQGTTNISDGLTKTIGTVMAQDTKLGQGIHHIVVFLSDGGHNAGTHPSTVIPLISNDMRKNNPNLRVSFLVIGVTGSSQTDIGMLAKTSFETVPLEGMDPIYFCKEASQMVSVLLTLQEGLRRQSGGRVVKMEASGNCKLVASVTQEPSSHCEVFMVPSAAKEGAALFAILPNGLEDLNGLKVDGVAADVQLVEFEEDVVIHALDTSMKILRQRKVARGSIDREVSELEPWINAFEFSLTKCLGGSMPNSESYSKLKPHERLQRYKTANAILYKSREIRNELQAIQAMQNDNSAAQASFLTGDKYKYAAKALIRAGGPTTVTELIEDLKTRAPLLRTALRKDALLLLKRMGNPTEAIDEMVKDGLNPKLCQLVYEPQVDIDDTEIGTFIESQLFPFLRRRLSLSESYLSLLSQWEQLYEWVACAANVEAEVTTEYEMLMYLGLMGMPIFVERWSATQMDAFQCNVTDVLPSSCDTASLCCALRSGTILRSPEGPELQDILMLIDPDCPNASTVAYWSKIAETLTSVVLCRDLHMYSGPAMKTALHAHALMSVIMKDPKEITARQILSIVYSIRKQWGATGAGQYIALLKRMCNWESLTEADEVKHPYQLLLGLCAVDLAEAGITEMTTPSKLTLCNETLSREARRILRIKVGSDHGLTRTEAYKLMEKLLSINETNSPCPLPPEESEPPIQEIRESCSCDYIVNESAFDYRGFIEKHLNLIVRAMTLSESIQKWSLNQPKGMQSFMECMEMADTKELEMIVQQSLQKSLDLNLWEFLGIEPRDIERTALTMGVQAFMYHMSGDRTELGDVTDGVTLRNMIIELRLDVYNKLLGPKQNQRRLIIGDMTYEKALNADESAFDSMIGYHAHGLSYGQFWSMARIARRDPKKRDIFLAKCNQGFVSSFNTNKKL